MVVYSSGEGLLTMSQSEPGPAIYLIDEESKSATGKSIRAKPFKLDEEKDSS